MSRYRRQPPRYGVLTLALASLLVVAPVLAQDSRGVAPGSVDKAELFAAGTARSMRALSVAVVEGEGFRDELLKENGGWFGEEMPWSANGTFEVATGTVPAPHPDLRVITVLVRTEIGIPVDATTFADEAMAILNDPRGWGDIDGVSFARSDVDAEADIVLTLASPATTEVLCGELPTHGYTSCGRGRPVNINGARWVWGAESFLNAGGTVEDYRVYVINHEFGHSLGHPHEQCPGPGVLAPTMLQQTLSVGSCTPNGWPNPAP